MILLIDNFDSFSYNLYQLIGEIDRNVKVIRNNDMNPSVIAELNPSCIIISPGPGKPKDAGFCEDIIRYFKYKKPILGICLGHQAICEVFGTKIIYAKEVMHGKTSKIHIDTTSSIFKNIPQEINVARYHSLVADSKTLSNELEVIAKTNDDIIMGIKLKNYNVFGLQFHPESILTEYGKNMMKNFIEITK